MATPARTSVDEPDLIRAARAGDRSALGALYERHGAGLYHTCRRLTGSAADAEDLVHDVFVGLPEALRQYEERGVFGAWIKRVAVRAALMHLRATERRRQVPLDPAATVTRDPRGARIIETQDLERAVAALPVKLRTVFVLKHVEGYSHDEIAAMLAITPGASRVRLTRALESLRRALG